MTEIALYNALRKIPELSDEEAKEAVADIANSKEVATTADIKNMATKADLKAGLAELKEALTWRIFIAIGLAAAVTSAIVKLLS